MSGSWTYWNEDGNKYSEETYKNGYKEGQFILYKDGNRQREGGYLNRKKHGIFIEWYDNGQKKQRGNFQKGVVSLGYGAIGMKRGINIKKRLIRMEKKMVYSLSTIPMVKKVSKKDGKMM